MVRHGVRWLGDNDGIVRHGIVVTVIGTRGIVVTGIGRSVNTGGSPLEGKVVVVIVAIEWRWHGCVVIVVFPGRGRWA